LAIARHTDGGNAAKGNILKMRLQLEVAEPELGEKKVDAH
jgi:hypothetical protein